MWVSAPFRTNASLKTKLVTVYKVSPFLFSQIMLCMLACVYFIFLGWSDWVPRFGGLIVALTVLWDVRLRRFGYESFLGSELVYKTRAFSGKAQNYETDYIDPKAKDRIVVLLLCAGTVCWAFGDWASELIKCQQLDCSKTTALVEMQTEPASNLTIDPSDAPAKADSPNRDHTDIELSITSPGSNN